MFVVQCLMIAHQKLLVILLLLTEKVLETKRRGSEKRKSYTVELKKKTLDLLDSSTSSKNKYKIVLRERGDHRSLVQKWNKNRSQIFKELELNKEGKKTLAT